MTNMEEIIQVIEKYYSEVNSEQEDKKLRSAMVDLDEVKNASKVMSRNKAGENSLNYRCW